MEIIIVGAGIAGLSAGIGLRRAGHKVTILEQSSLLHETGAAITITPNASRVLRAWDFDVESSRMVAISTGSLLNGATMEVLVPVYFGNIEETYGAPLYSVHRVDLHNQLRRLATQQDRPGCPVDIQVQAKIVDYDAADGKAILEDGKTLQADLVIAADGVHSTAVGVVLGDKQIQASNTGWSCMRWLVPTKELLSDPETSTLVKDSVQRYFMGAPGAGALVWYPCRNNEVQNFLYLSQSFDDSHATEDFRATVEASVPMGYAEKDFGPALQAVIRKARDVKFWKLVAREPIPSWHKDRLVVIGDAAHPMLTFQAQGGGQAIEDGAALGVLLDQLYDKGTLEARLGLFEQTRRNRASAVQILSNTSPPVPESVRDAAARYLPDGKRFENMDDINEYLWSFDVVKESKAALA
ncbi:MAG: salicylate hydroxylase [Lasallia pustulata]|uniref:Salicylate hydroxylase n=1 Tax=Lasallia pustulata TaxID=136370 RepID=A0A5M8PCE0_9LECA|nr:MAG: salicylate hydroxylase [Lasallia pustulata]